MEETRREKYRTPGQVPYLPPPPGGKERFRRALRRYAFTAACVLFLAIFGTSLWLLPYHHASNGAPTTARSELQYTPWETDEAEASMLPTVSATSPGTAALSVTTQPVGATVSVDMTTVGTTPLRGHVLPAGAYVLSIEKEGYLPVDTVILLESERPARLSLALNARGTDDAPPRMASAPTPSEAHGTDRPSRSAVPPRGKAREQSAPTPSRGTLRLVTHPVGASVHINGRPVGETPVRIVDIPAGAHTVTLQARGYQPLTREVTVRPAETRTIEERLPPLTGTLSIRIEPWGSIYIDGTLRKSEADVRYRTSLPVGPHRLTVVHPDLGTWEKTIHVTKGETASVRVDFNTAAPENVASRTNGALSGW